MCSQCDIDIEETWAHVVSRLQQGPGRFQLHTPSGQANFEVVGIGQTSITVSIGQNQQNVALHKSQFYATVWYLRSHAVIGQPNGVEIQSNQVYEEAGPVCQASRHPGGQRVSTYILPILRDAGIVACGGRPVEVWLLR